MTRALLVLAPFSFRAVLPIFIRVDRWRSDRWMKNIDRDLRATREALR